MRGFVSDDSFLRHGSCTRHIRKRIVQADIFDDKHETLSLTFQDEDLQTDLGLDAYQRYKALPSGDLPGLVKLTFHDLVEVLRPPLTPRWDPDPQDERYGDLHCCTHKPHSAVQREVMAELANRHGVLRECVQKKHRKDVRAS